MSVARYSGKSADTLLADRERELDEVMAVFAGHAEVAQHAHLIRCMMTAAFTRGAYAGQIHGAAAIVDLQHREHSGAVAAVRARRAKDCAGFGMDEPEAVQP